MTKPMNKEGLQDPLRVMEAPVEHGISLDRVDMTFLLIAKEFIDWKVVNCGIDKEWPQILQQEERSIRNLRTKVLKCDGEFIQVSIAVILEFLAWNKNNRPLFRPWFGRQGKALSSRIVFSAC